MSDGILSNDEDTRLLAEVLVALDRRIEIPGGAARHELDRRIQLGLRRLRRPQAVGTRPMDGPPPRPIAVAMALMVFSQPHMVATFGRPGERPEGRGPLTPLLVPHEPLAEMLGLARWELDELQGEVDRRVAIQLKQHRVLGWLWGHFGLPKEGVGALVEVLLPGLRGEASRVGLSRRGGQLYAQVEQPRSPRPDSLYFGWLDRDVEGAYAPRGTFDARYVDRSLRRRIGRSIGADDEEILRLLDRMVTVIPRKDARDFLALDRYRAHTYDGIIGLAGPYSRTARLTDAPAVDEVSFEGWLRRSGQDVQVDNGKALFDSVALNRVSEVARQLHAHILATFLQGGDRAALGPGDDELVRYHVTWHLRAVLEPLLAWTRDPRSAERVARRLGVEPDRAALALAGLEAVWRQHLDTTWLGSPSSGQPASVAVRLAAQLVRTRDAIGDLWLRAPDGQEHREALLLFAGHYFAEAPVDRLWGRARDGLAEDPVGRWFWPAWQKVLDSREYDSNATGEFVFDF